MKNKEIRALNHLQDLQSKWAFKDFRKDKSNWIFFDDEIQKQIDYKIKDWKERGREWSGTFFTDSIFRRIAELIEEDKKEFVNLIDDTLEIERKRIRNLKMPDSNNMETAVINFAVELKLKLVEK